MRQKWNIIFSFSISQGEELQLAELQLHLSTPERNFPSTSDPIRVDLFHQHDTSCQNGRNCPHIVHLGSFTVSPPFPSSWIVLEVTQQLSKWFTKSSSVKKSFQNDLVKWNTKHSLKRVTSRCRSANEKAFLVLFSSISKGEGESSTLLQTVKSTKYFVHRTSKDIRPHWDTKRHRRHKKPLNSSLSGSEPESRGLCRRVDFHVDFDQIGWGSWIVHPKQYNAFRCEGKCPVPLDEGFQPTNNAYIQVRVPTLTSAYSKAWKYAIIDKITDNLLCSKNPLRHSVFIEKWYLLLTSSYLDSGTPISYFKQSKHKLISLL